MADLPARESMEFDVVVVGAGPAGLATAIRLKQQRGRGGRGDLRRRGREGLRGRRAHPVRRGDRPDRPRRPSAGVAHRSATGRSRREVTARRVPVSGPCRRRAAAQRVHAQAHEQPRQLHRLARQRRPLSRPQGGGARRRDLSRLPGRRSARRGRQGRRHRDRRHGHRPQRRAQCQLHPRHGAARQVHDLRARARAAASPSSWSSASASNAGRDHQKYGIGIKELWQVKPEKHRPGLVRHSMGWPLPNNAGGGSWLYHFDDNLVSVGFVVHLNYKNPTLSPFDEFQRFKTHPMIRDVFEGGKRIGYGARAIMEGGWQSVPRLVVPGRLPRRRLGRLRERAAHQGQPQRDPVGHALRRARVRGAAGGPGA